MSLCVSCGLQLAGEASLCPHHHSAFSDDWAAVNRIVCDFVHRGLLPPRVAKDAREPMSITDLDLQNEGDLIP